MLCKFEFTCDHPDFSKGMPSAESGCPGFGISNPEERCKKSITTSFSHSFWSIMPDIEQNSFGQVWAGEIL